MRVDCAGIAIDAVLEGCLKCLILGKASTDCVIGRYIIKGIAGYRSYRTTIHQYISHMITGIGSNGKGLVTTVRNRDCAARTDGAVRPGVGGNSMSYAHRREAGAYGVIGNYISECIACDRTHTGTIDQDILHRESRVRSNDERLAGTLCYDYSPAGRNRTVRARRSHDRVRHHRGQRSDLGWTQGIVVDTNIVHVPFESGRPVALCADAEGQVVVGDRDARLHGALLHAVDVYLDRVAVVRSSQMYPGRTVVGIHGYRVEPVGITRGHLVETHKADAGTRGGRGAGE